LKFVSGRGSARLAAPIGVGALLLALAATDVARPAPADLPALRTTLDSEPDARPRWPARPKRTRSSDPEPAGQVPSFGVPSFGIPSFGTPAGSGAGKTGFVSTRTKAKARTRSPAAKIAEPPPLPLSPTGMVMLPERPPTSDKSPAPPPARPTRTPPPRVAGRPVLAPRAPALVQREEVKEQLNAQPNTVVAIRRKPEDDPFEPVGLRAGAFVLRSAVETTGGYNSNPGQVSGGKGSWFIAPGGELLARSDWVRHELAAEIRGSYTAYEATPELDAPNLAARLAGRIDVSERTRGIVEGRYLLAATNPGSPGLPVDLAELPIVQTAGASAGVLHRFNRLEVALKGSFDRVEWGDSKLTDGAIISNEDRDYNQYGVQTRASYELTPGVKPFVDVAVDTRDYDLLIDAGGVARSSDGIAAKAGTSFELTRTLVGEAAIGYVTRTYQDPSLPDLRGVLVDASLLWAATGLTNVKLIVTTTPQETNLVGVSGILSYDTTLQVDHAFRRWLIGTARLSYGLDDFVGSPRQDQRYAVSGALIYKLTRTFQVKGEVRQEWRRSNEPGNDYEATMGLVGLRWQP
jgi:hypothetical protein